VPPADPSEACTIPPAPEGAYPTGPGAEVPGEGEPPTPGGLTVPRVAGYEILGELGRGGMGVVYKANQTKLNRQVALKMILAGGHASDDERRRFFTEAEAVARLQHPGIVQIHEIGEADGHPFFSLEFCPGGSLAGKLNGTPLPPKEAARLVETLARAVQAAHEAGVVHRDLKPANVLLAADGTPKITDFGLAKKLGDAAGPTASGAVMGTPSYMAPEQAGGKSEEIGPAADVYALGAVLYECLTGRPPFKAATAFDTVLQVIGEEPVPPRILQHKVPRDLETVCLKCLRKEPAQRYISAKTLADDLCRFLQDEPIHARRPGLAERGSRWLRKQRRGVVLALATAAASVFMVAGALLGWSWYAAAQLGTLRLTTDGPALTGEVFADRDHGPPLQRFTVPTAEPLSLPAGSYRVRLSREGLLSQTYQLQVQRGVEHQFDVALNEQELWPPLSLDGADLVQVVRLADRDALFVLEPGRRGNRLRRLDGATGKDAWPGPVMLDAKDCPPGHDPNEWCSLLAHMPGVDDPPALVEPAPKLAADGTGDLVWASRTSPSLLAVSGRDGRLLWWYRSPSVLPGAAKVVGVPVAVPQTKPPDLIATFVRYMPGARIDPRPWIERVTVVNGQARALWRYPLADDGFPTVGVELPGSMFPVQVVPIEGRPAVVAVLGRHLVGLDLRTGKELWPPHDLGFAPVQQPQFAYLKGNGSTCIVLNGARLTAWSLPPGPHLRWEAPGSVRDWGYEIGKMRKGEIRVIDHRENGRPGAARTDIAADVLVPVMAADSKPPWLGLRLLQGSDGLERWHARWRLGPWSKLHSSLEFLAGPDLDGDGYREVFLAFATIDLPQAAPGTSNSDVSMLVYALSGKDGRTLWWWQDRLPELGRVEPLRWGPLGRDGRPQLVVPVTQGANRSPSRTYLFAAGAGKLEQILPGVADPRAADLDGDGLEDLFYTHSHTASVGPADTEGLTPPLPDSLPRTEPRTVQLHAVRGLSPEAWRRLGEWHVAGDLDGDGRADLVRLQGPDLMAISSRDGTPLWPARRSQGGRLTTAPISSPSDLPIRSPTGLVLAVAAPQSDLNGDGSADLFVLGGYGRAPSLSGTGYAFPALHLISGKDGRRLWEAKELPVTDSFPADSGTPVCHDLKRPGGPKVVLACMHGHDRLLLVSLSADDGRLLWQQHVCNLPSRTAAFGRRCWPQIALADTGRGGLDLVLWVPGSPELRAYAGGDGALLWRHATLLRDLDSELPTLLPAPTVGELDGVDGQAVVVADRDGVTAFDAHDGSPRWSYPVRHGIRLHDGDSAMPILADLNGTGRCYVCLATRGLQPEVIVLDGRGKERSRRRLTPGSPIPGRALLWHHDLLGDGREELLFVAEGKLRATRGGVGAEHEVWAWQPPGSPLTDSCLDVVAIEPASDGRPATVVVHSPSPDALHGLSGADGRPVWRAPASRTGGRLLPVYSGHGQELPRLIYVRPGHETVCRMVMAADEQGRCRLSGSTPETYQTSVDDPRFSRPLPWVALAEFQGALEWVYGPYGPYSWGRLKATVLHAMWLLPLVLALGLFTLPVWLLRRAVRNRSWRPALLLVGWAVLVGLAVAFAPLPPSGGRAWIVIPAVPLVLLGLAGVELLGHSFTWAVHRRWQRLALLLALFLLGTLLVAGIWLAVDTRHREAGEHYSWALWYVAAVPGFYAAGLLFVIGSFLGEVTQSLWSPRRRNLL
jgi:outer membrane protein assembly factor BamB